MSIYLIYLHPAGLPLLIVGITSMLRFDDYGLDNRLMHMQYNNRVRCQYHYINFSNAIFTLQLLDIL